MQHARHEAASEGIRICRLVTHTRSQPRAHTRARQRRADRLTRAAHAHTTRLCVCAVAVCPAAWRCAAAEGSSDAVRRGSDSAEQGQLHVAPAELIDFCDRRIRSGVRKQAAGVRSALMRFRVACLSVRACARSAQVNHRRLFSSGADEGDGISLVELVVLVLLAERSASSLLSECLTWPQSV
jgi:hypothetical protein